MVAGPRPHLLPFCFRCFPPSPPQTRRQKRSSLRTGCLCPGPADWLSSLVLRRRQGLPGTLQRACGRSPRCSGMKAGAVCWSLSFRRTQTVTSTPLKMTKTWMASSKTRARTSSLWRSLCLPGTTAQPATGLLCSRRRSRLALLFVLGKDGEMLAPQCCPGHEHG